MNPGRDYIGTSAGCVIFDTAGRIFMAKRGLGARDDQGTWEFPGGSIHFGETREQALNRIIREKYGFEIEIQNILGVYDVIDEVMGDHWISTTYVSKYIFGTPDILIPDKCSEIGWFSLPDITSMDLSRITQRNLRDLLRQYS